MSLGILDSETLIVNTYFTKKCSFESKNSLLSVNHMPPRVGIPRFRFAVLFLPDKILSLFESITMALNLHKK